MSNEDENSFASVEQLIQKLGLPEEEAKSLRKAVRFKRMTREQQFAFLEPEQDVAERIQNEARVGRFVDPEKLRAIDFSHVPKSPDDREYPDEEYKKIADRTRKNYLANIEEYGNDAIAHLCPPYTIIDGLRERSGRYLHIPTISALEDHIQEYGERREEAIIRPHMRDIVSVRTRVYVHKLFEQYEAWTHLPPASTPPAV